MRIRAKGLLAITLFVAAVVFPIVADGAVVTVDSINVQPGESFAVDVNMSNNTDSISALTVPLKFNNSELMIDSVSFVGSMLTNEFQAVVDIDNASEYVRISYVPDQNSTPLPIIDATSGVIGTIYFTMSASANQAVTVIDSVYDDQSISFGGHIIHIYDRIEFSDQEGIQTYLPSFFAGAIMAQVSTGINDGNDGLLPTEFSLGQNYPNPFNPTTKIEFSVPRAGNITLKVYNVIGQEVATIAEGHYSAGIHTVEFDGANQPSGVYFYKLFHEEGAETRKMMMVK